MENIYIYIYSLDEKHIHICIDMYLYISRLFIFHQLKTVLKNASFVKRLGIRTLDAFILSTDGKPTVGVGKIIQEKREKNKDISILGMWEVLQEVERREECKKKKKKKRPMTNIYEMLTASQLLINFRSIFPVIVLNVDNYNRIQCDSSNCYYLIQLASL